MNKELLNTVYQDFINNNLDRSIEELAFRKSLFPEIQIRDLLQQIKSKLKSKDKLPSWFSTKGIYYPKSINIEQTSSEITAAFKASLIEGESLIDLTMGFGVDSFYFSERVKEVEGCEINKELFEITTHNFSVLHKNNITTINANGIIYLKTLKRRFDWIYIDPSRRDDIKGKVYKFEDSSPNIIPELGSLFSFGERIMIKSSPLIDLSLGIKELAFVKEIHLLAVNNELKELLWILDKSSDIPTKISSININKGKHEIFEFNWGEEQQAKLRLGSPKKYLFEPNVAILKSGAFNLLASNLNLEKIHRHSHLYTSNNAIDFPGRSFVIKSVHSYNKKTLKKILPKKANISTRNFPKTVALIRKELSIKDGGEDYLFFTVDKDNDKIVIWCKPLL